MNSDKDFEAFALAEWERRKSERALAAASRKRLQRFANASTIPKVDDRNDKISGRTKTQNNLSLCSISTIGGVAAVAPPSTEEIIEEEFEARSDDFIPKFQQKPVQVHSLKSLTMPDGCSHNEKSIASKANSFCDPMRSADSLAVGAAPPQPWIDTDRLLSSSRLRKKALSSSSSSSLLSKPANKTMTAATAENPASAANAQQRKKKVVVLVVDRDAKPRALSVLPSNQTASVSATPKTISKNEAAPVFGVAVSSSFEFEYGMDPSSATCTTG